MPRGTFRGRSGHHRTQEAFFSFPFARWRKCQRVARIREDSGCPGYRRHPSAEQEASAPRGVPVIGLRTAERKGGGSEREGWGCCGHPSSLPALPPPPLPDREGARWVSSNSRETAGGTPHHHWSPAHVTCIVPLPPHRVALTEKDPTRASYRNVSPVSCSPRPVRFARHRLSSSPCTLPLGSRPTDPCSTAVGTEAFSTPVLNHRCSVLPRSRLNSRYCNQDLLRGPLRPASWHGLRRVAPASLYTPQTLPVPGGRTSWTATCAAAAARCGRGAYTGLGTIRFRSRPLRQVSCYTLLSGFQPS